MLPFVGLRSDQCLVNDTAERMAQEYHVQAHPVVNPATGLPGAVTALNNKQSLEAKGLTTWDSMGYLTLCFAETLRKRGACFIDCKIVGDQLKRLEIAFPAVVRAAKARFSVEEITRVLRGLAVEVIPIRNLVLILERLLDYEYCCNPSIAPAILNDYLLTNSHWDPARRNDPVSLLSFIRAGLKRQISNQYARGTTTMVVYLLDPEIERRLANFHSSQGLDEREHDRILDALRDELTFLPPTAQVPVILTSIDVRLALRQLLAQEFPRLSVVCYQELMPDLNIMPIARILLKT